MNLRESVRDVPGLGTAAVFASRTLRRLRFGSSASYWERRYRHGGNSGAGSYGRVARFKASFLNEFVRQHTVATVVEFGCGDGAQLALAEYPRYVGLDVSATAIDRCWQLHGHDPSKSFLLYDPLHFHNRGAVSGELVLSLDVILHLVEDEVLDRYLDHLAGAATRFIVVFTENTTESNAAAHVRYRTVDSWRGRLAGWEIIDSVSNPYHGPDSEADFYVFARVPSV